LYAYPIHKNITVTYFFVGELPSKNNKFISNVESAWDDIWMWHYGGVDDPKNRVCFYPKKFIPNENPFYVALPYNDLYPNGKVKPSQKKIPWYKGYTGTSIIKNRWVKIIKHYKNGKIKVCYAQWEDAGPNEYDDFDYVFGNKRPKNSFNAKAGIDVSPAVKDYLKLKDIDKVDWQFVDFKDVPNGPWKKIITTTPVTFIAPKPIKAKYFYLIPIKHKWYVTFLDFLKKPLKHKYTMCIFNPFFARKNEINKKLLGKKINNKYYLNIKNKKVLKFIYKKIKFAKKMRCKGLIIFDSNVFMKNSGFDISAFEEYDFLRKIAIKIKENGMYAGIKNSVLISDLAPLYDFGIYSQKCYYLLNILKKYKKPVIKIKVEK